MTQSVWSIWSSFSRFQVS